MNEIKKIFIIGYFGEHSRLLDGQSVKTRSILEMSRRNVGAGGKVRHYDTERFRHNPFSVFSIIKNSAWCDNLIIIPQDNSLRYIFPFVYLLSRIFRFNVIHIAIGSEQTIFFRNKKWFHNSYIRMGRNIRAFLLQVGTVEKELREEFGFRNTGISRNFRIHDFTPEIANYNTGLRIVFMSRVTPKKGTAMVFEIGEYIAQKYPDGDVTIDIYGQIFDEENFTERIAASKTVDYKGELAPEDIYKTMNGYDLFFLPTRRYYGEGFPGAILDAYISGIPVLVSEWAYAHEFVLDGETGFIHNMDDKEAFCRTIDLLYNDKELLLERKRSAWEESKKYSEAEAWREIEKYL